MTSPNRRRTYYLQLRLNDWRANCQALPCFIGFDSYWGRAGTYVQGQRCGRGRAKSAGTRKCAQVGFQLAPIGAQYLDAQVLTSRFRSPLMREYQSSIRETL